jgi:acetoin utilization protein AcuB
MNNMEITVEEYTSPIVVTIDPAATLDRALELMQENQIRHLPVMRDEKVLGLLSERDLLTHFGKDWTKMMRVGDIMSTSLLSVYASDNLGDVAFQLSNKKVGSALVLDEDDSLYGIFTTTDALNALVEIFYPLGQKSERSADL